MFKTPSKDKNEGRQLAEEKQVAVQRKSDEFFEARTTTAHYSPDESDIACSNFDQNLEISDFFQMRKAKEPDAQHANMFNLN